MPLPIYQTVNQGTQHEPKYRSTVTIDGLSFRSSSAFHNKKAAEQHIAKLALREITKKVKEDIPLIHYETVFCKSILHEYAAKMNIGMPTYKTSRVEGLLPVFTSSVTFGGRSYTGVIGKSKKEAEQLGARAVIESILGKSCTRTPMLEIINAKGRLYDAINKGRDFRKEQHVGNKLCNDLQAGLIYDRSLDNVISEPVQQIGPTGTLLNDSQAMVPTSSKKRLRNDEETSQRKKTRTNN